MSHLANGTLVTVNCIISPFHLNGGLADNGQMMMMMMTMMIFNYCFYLKIHSVVSKT